MRKHFNAPKAKFVCAILGQPDIERPDASEVGTLKLELPSCPPKYLKRNGKVGTVCTNPPGMRDRSNGHRSNSSKSNINVGLSMEDAMLKVIKRSKSVQITNLPVPQHRLTERYAPRLLTHCAICENLKYVDKQLESRSYLDQQIE